MRFKLLLFLILGITATLGTFAQEKKANKPQMMFIINGEEVSQEYALSLKPEQIKELKMGVSGDEKAALIKKYGEQKVNESLINVIVLKTEEEIKNSKQITPEEAAEINRKNAEERAKKLKESTLVNSGDLAKDFTLEMIDGSKIKLSELKGKVVLINFWATWCAPCMKEFYEFPEKIVKPFTDKDFVLLPISRGEKKEVVRKKMEKLKTKGIDFNVGIDPTQEIYKLYATNFIPRNFLIDRNGKVVYTSVGYDETKLDELVKKIEELMK